MESFFDAAETIVEVVDKSARVAFVAGGAWLLGHWAWRILGSLLIDADEQPSDSKAA